MDVVPLRTMSCSSIMLTFSGELDNPAVKRVAVTVMGSLVTGLSGSRGQREQQE